VAFPDRYISPRVWECKDEDLILGQGMVAEARQEAERSGRTATSSSVTSGADAACSNPGMDATAASFGI